MMTTDDLKVFLKRGEDIRTEYKQGYESVPSSFYETVASFSNTDGGIILLGVNDDGAVTGINPAFEIKIKKDLVTALNSPDCIYPTVSVEPITKNPNIRRFFTALGWADEIGSGIRNTNKYLPLYVEGAKPVFAENETFTALIPLVFVTLQDFTKQFQQWLGLPDDAFPHLQKGLGVVALPSSLKNLSWENLLLHLAPAWHQKGAEFPELKWPEKQLFEKEISKSQEAIPTSEVSSSTKKGIKLSSNNISDYQVLMSEYFKKVSSSTEKGAKLMAKRSHNLVSILALTTIPISRDEMMHFMSYGNRVSFSELYLKPLLQCEFIDRTVKDKPRASNQQYIITEKGKAFLGGLMA